jgi:hypothetical protein
MVPHLKVLRIHSFQTMDVAKSESSIKQKTRRESLTLSFSPMAANYPPSQAAVLCHYCLHSWDQFLFLAGLKVVLLPDLEVMIEVSHFQALPDTRGGTQA